MTNRWEFEKPAPSAFKVMEHYGIPVVFRGVGHYDEATNGTVTTREVPHIQVLIQGGWVNGREYFSGVLVRAVAPDGHTWKYAEVFKTPLTPLALDGDATPDRWIAEGEAHLDEALAALDGLDEAYSAARAIMLPAYAYSGAMIREAYEVACAACGVDALPDADCDSYGVRNGEFGYPTYPAAVVAQMRLAYLRLLGIDADQAKSAPVPQPDRVPAPQGQLWEPCPHCGQEPVLMPLMVCAACWPKDTAAEQDSPKAK